MDWILNEIKGKIEIETKDAVKHNTLMPHNNVRSTFFGSSDTSLSTRFINVLKKKHIWNTKVLWARSH